MSTLPIDFDLVLRKARLRSYGDSGLAALVLVLRSHGIHADLLSRNARVIRLESIGEKLWTVREQEQSVIRIGEQILSQENDRSWLEVLERFHFEIGMSNVNLVCVGTGNLISTYSSFIKTPDIAVVKNENLNKKSSKLPKDKLELLRRVVEENLGYGFPLPQRRKPPQLKLIEQLENNNSEVKYTQMSFMEDEQMLAIRNLGKNYGKILDGLTTYTTKISQQPVEVLAKQIFAQGSEEFPSFFHGYRVGLRPVHSNNVLALVEPGHWNSLSPLEEKIFKIEPDKIRMVPVLISASHASYMTSEWLEGEADWSMVSPGIKRFLLRNQVEMIKDPPVIQNRPRI